MFLLFGIGTAQRDLGPGGTRTCPRCRRTTTWGRVKQFSQLTAFLVPVARRKQRTLEVCGLCGSTVEG